MRGYYNKFLRIPESNPKPQHKTSNHLGICVKCSQTDEIIRRGMCSSCLETTYEIVETIQIPA